MTPSSKIEGCRVYWDEKKEWVEYKTHSEALLASLALCHIVPLETVDLFVELLCNEDFRPSDVSFSKATDIYSAVGVRRQLKAWKRSHPDTSSVSVAGFPNSDMFEKVLDVLTEERRNELEDFYGPSFVSAERFEETDPNSTPIAQTLEAMSLVHRSWTIPAQKARRCFAIVDNAHPSGWCNPCIELLENPTLAFVDTVLFRDRSKTWLDSTPVLLKGLILHPYSRGLRTLHIELDLCKLKDSKVYEVSLKRLTRALESLTALRHLEVLSIRYLRDKFDPLIAPLCSILIRLPCLESFRLFISQRKYYRIQDLDFPSWLKDKHPTTSLKSVNVSIKDAILLSWLTTPRAGFQLDRIGLLLAEGSSQPSQDDLYTNFYPALSSALAPALPFVKSLTIHGAIRWSPGKHCITDVRSIELASSVKTLNLRIDVMTRQYFRSVQFDQILNRIQPSVQRLSLLLFLFFPDPQDAFTGKCKNNLDEALSRYIDGVESLKWLQIVVDDSSRDKKSGHYRQSPVDFWANEAPWLPLARERCKDRGIVWSCRVDDVTRFHIV